MTSLAYSFRNIFVCLLAVFQILAISSIDADSSTQPNNNETNTSLQEHLVVQENENDLLNHKLQEHLQLFTVSEEIAALGPTVFPKPTRLLEDLDRAAGTAKNQDVEYVICIQPTHGTHRPDQDAILLFAAEYALHNYMIFLHTLRDTGFAGDVVMGLSTMDWDNHEVREYLEFQEHVVVYVVGYTCFNAEGQEVDSAKGGIRVCKTDNLYGRKEHVGNKTITPLPDPRHARTLQNSRYELYWIWSTHYNNYSWIMLIDARDTIFQRNPFDLVPREKGNNPNGGLLIFFGENVEATRLGKSSHNRDWLNKAYGLDVADALAEKPTICSGSTMGEQVAVEMYLRAMVAEADETKTVKMGADQGFHNRLYYSNKLANAIAIRDIIVQDQGFGIINNLGALRIKPLNQWFNGRLLEVVRPEGSTENDGSDITAMNVRNWDSTLSPVVHQFDRHQELSNWYFKRKRRELHGEWIKQKKQQKGKASEANHGRTK